MLPTPVQGQLQHLKYQNRIKKTAKPDSNSTKNCPCSTVHSTDLAVGKLLVLDNIQIRIRTPSYLSIYLYVAMHSTFPTKVLIRFDLFLTTEIVNSFSLIQQSRLHPSRVSICDWLQTCFYLITVFNVNRVRWQVVVTAE